MGCCLVAHYFWCPSCCNLDSGTRGSEQSIPTPLPHERLLHQRQEQRLDGSCLYAWLPSLFWNHHRSCLTSRKCKDVYTQLVNSGKWTKKKAPQNASAFAGNQNNLYSRNTNTKASSGHANKEWKYNKSLSPNNKYTTKKDGTTYSWCTRPGHGNKPMWVVHAPETCQPLHQCVHQIILGLNPSNNDFFHSCSPSCHMICNGVVLLIQTWLKARWVLYDWLVVAEDSGWSINWDTKLWTLMWSHEWSPVRTTVANAK